jgi:D-3-phosphoglycerate dehydrogenase
MARVVVTDYSFDSLDVERAVLEPLGVELIARAHCKPDELRALVADADCVITQFAPVNAAVIGAMRRARAIVRYGVGVDNVDLDAAQARGIPVCNVPDYCIDEVADHTFAFILALTRQVVANAAEVRAGRWRLAVPLPDMRAVCELTVGIVGFGRIGRAVAQRLVAFRARLLVHDPLVPAADIERSGSTSATLADLLAGSDLVTLHCPSTAATRRLLNREAFARMKPGALLVNVGRGDLVETASLIEALEQGRLRGAALDVCDPEPVPPDSPLLRMDNVLVTAHIASASVKAVRTLRETAARLAARAIRGETLANVVNGVPANPRPSSC